MPTGYHWEIMAGVGTISCPTSSAVKRTRLSTQTASPNSSPFRSIQMCMGRGMLVRPTTCPCCIAHSLCSGPVNVSFPTYFWNSSAVLFAALNEIGVPTAYDPNAGLVAGAAFLPMDISPGLEERSTASRAYYDPYISRPNLWVSTGQTVTQILFDGVQANPLARQPIPDDTANGQGGSPGIPTGIFGGTTTINVTEYSQTSFIRRLWRGFRRAILKRQNVSSSQPLVAVGVEYAQDAGSARATVSATREVIVAAGALHSPQLLMLSGIGPSSVLQAAQVTVNLALPGVGSNLQE